MTRSRLLEATLVAAALFSATPAASTQTTVSEGFSGGSNQGEWSWGTGNQSISPLNGNPGAFLQDLTLFTAHPILAPAAMGPPTAWEGNFRDRGVTSVGVDLLSLIHI